MDRKTFIKSVSLLSISSQMMSLNSLFNLVTDHKIEKPLPIIFLGHGSPMNAIEKNEFTDGWRHLAEHLENVKAILCVSAHWETKGTYITGMKLPKTIHDFGGFPQVLYDVQYPAPGDPELAMEIQQHFKDHILIDHDWGLDHGCWSVLMHIFPKANVPVLQLSLDYRKDPEYHYQLAKKLTELRRKGVLIVGSGNMVHNLRALNWTEGSGGYDWAVEANEKFKELINKQDHEALTQYSKLGKAVQNAVPTPEHYLPLLYVLGMRNKNETAYYFNDKTMMGSISMTSVAFGLN